MQTQSSGSLVGKRAWSFSRLKTFEQCPRKFQALNVTKEVKERPSQATEEGSRVHKMFEERIRDKTPFPKGYERYERYAKGFDVFPGKVLVECKFALTEDLKPCEFFAPNVHSRAIADVLAIASDQAVMIDWKTGKNRGFEDGTQLNLAAYHIFKHNPHLKKIIATYIWVNEDDRSVVDITPNDMPDIWSYFLPRLERLQNAYKENVWPVQPNSLCKMYCPVTSCPHNGRAQ